jgi:cyclophilin family peptidyl-prolyl cis-trans isomerase/HEAT repeat protein
MIINHQLTLTKSLGKILFLFLLFTIFIPSCVPPTDWSSTETELSIEDPTIQTILNFQDKDLTDSLINYFNHPSPGIRFAAVKAFASSKDVKALPRLHKMLKDPILEIRSMAAFAIGQIGSPASESALISAFSVQDTLDVNSTYNENILEALGKCGSKTTLKNIASVVTYRPTDTRLLMGQIRGIYRFGQRAIFDESARTTALNYATDFKYPREVRLMAAHYLARFKEVEVKTSSDILFSTIENEKDNFIKMALITAAGRINTPESAKKLITLFDLEKDYRVQCNIVRSIGNSPMDSIKTDIFRFIKNPNPLVAATAAEIIGKRGNKEDLFEYRSLINNEMDWTVRTTLYQSILKLTPVFFTKFKNEMVAEILSKFNTSKNSYEKAGYIKAIGNDPYQYLTLTGMKDKVSSNIEKTTLVETLGDILKHPEFYKAYGSNFGTAKQNIINFLVQACKSGDAGPVAMAGSILKNPEIVAKEFIYDSTWYEVSKAKLKLPKDIEAYNELSEAYFMMKDSVYAKPKVPYNHPMNFAVLKDLGDTIKMVVKTNKGNIVMNLFPKKSPGSVINFIELCKKDFYDNKVIHRVVPNFLFQAGCPRGDGYGAEDYTIRTETAYSYYLDEGFVGMASAGDDTEGTQFFVSTSPCPHLDGKYTIFGKVVEGMDVVHSIQIGDKIVDAILLKN